MGRLPAEIVGAFGLAVVAVAAWAVAAGRFGPQAVTLWLVNGLFATNQILYVQLRIHEARIASHSLLSGDRAILLAVEAFTAVFLIGAWRDGWVPGLAAVAFLPLFVRAAMWSLGRKSRPLQIHRLGKTELVHAILFGLVVIVAFRLSIP